MKLWWILVALLMVSSVSAIINVDGPSREVFNLGDKIDVKGYILETEDMWSLFKLSLDCESSMPLVTRTVNLKKDEKYNFDEKLTVPVYLAGTCAIDASVSVNGNVIEQIKSRSFSISKDLEGRFKVKDNLIQLGKDIVLEGTVFKLDGTNINGLATLYFKLGEIAFVDTINVVNGKFEYVKSSMAHQAGVYNVDVAILDSYGNQKTFENAVQLTLVDEIYVFAKPTKEQIVPGTAVHLIGEAKTILQADINEGSVLIVLDDKEYETTIKNSKFSYDISLPNDIKSGKHVIEVFVEDALGNKGITETEIDVTPVPSVLKAEVINGVHVPGSTLVLKPVLIDQGGDFIIEDISVEIISSDGDVVHSTVVKTNEEIKYDFSQYAEPGNWEIKTYATGLKNIDVFILGETVSADFSLANQSLLIVNTGNIKYKKPVEIVLTSGGLVETVIEKVSLGPGESEELNLGHYVESGVYIVEVAGKTYDEIYITSTKKISYDWIFWVIIAVFLALLAYLFLFRGKRLRSLIKKRKEEEKTISETFKVEKREPEEKKISKFEEEAKKKKYAKEFRDRILKELEKRKPHLRALKKEAEEKKPSPVKAEDLVKEE